MNAIKNCEIIKIIMRLDQLITVFENALKDVGCTEEEVTGLINDFTILYTSNVIEIASSGFEEAKIDDFKNSLLSVKSPDQFRETLTQYLNDLKNNKTFDNLVFEATEKSIPQYSSKLQRKFSTAQFEKVSSLINDNFTKLEETARIG